MGMMLIFFSVTYAMPIVTSIIYDDGALFEFVDALAFCLLVGIGLWWPTRHFKRELQPRDGFLLVTLAWIMMAGIATAPLMMAIPNLSFTDAFFETMSGLTTTGATVLVGLEHLPPSINIWRHELCWLGGMGIIVLAVAILPLLGVGGMQLYKAETPGPMKDSRLTPRIASTAKALWLVYFGITAACILSLKAVGMNWLDAICHAFAALSLGGFSTYDASIGQFDSPAIEAVLIVFMMLAGINFATHFVALHGRTLRAYWKDYEAKAFVSLIVASTLVCATYLSEVGTYKDWGTAFRHVAFNLVSIATDCGFTSVDYDKWPVFVPMWMLLLSCFSVSSGSTGGGIKMIRALILSQQALRELQKLIHPAIVNPIHVGGSAIPQNIAGAVLGFIFLYALTVGELTFLLMASGLDFISSFTAIIACINNAGPGLNVIGPAQNYGVLTDFQTWVCSLAMLAGRLEIFTLFVLFTPYFWRR
ncbi:potassium transporter TrkG [Propionivibrio sp.]|uniref:TrkH family potassium uptake protein n=2 Tax=Propionivibrio sp. TaxID=2212460 RepID=UPI0025D9AD8D|nr:potassium transporter TrkG [Propionivibrio sp.]MBK7354852.1 TrkH family potassium uptake protein [Propionivibrio sp.]MBK8402220.1 TrkH family potassium uptake protein [Propionivibrio sp.]MBK8745910.1 TrkH family potassium uptake protein [Propionivibrio sp.]MBK8892677.1 TrkH family potassium uptake protein [Propionivibrio sp.]MBL0207433.1 TrkH family potassium uptake protein [Propionivibrio sp.]